MLLPWDGHTFLLNMALWLLFWTSRSLAMARPMGSHTILFNMALCYGYGPGVHSSMARPLTLACTLIIVLALVYLWYDWAVAYFVILVYMVIWLGRGLSVLLVAFLWYDLAMAYLLYSLHFCDMTWPWPVCYTPCIFLWVGPWAVCYIHCILLWRWSWPVVILHWHELHFCDGLRLLI